MKIKTFREKVNTTLSCISKCLRFLNLMIHKKLILGSFLFCFLGACASPTAMLGPAYTLTSTGSPFQAGFTYGSGELVTMYTGKTPIENIQEIAEVDKKNFQKKTWESEDFYILVQNKIEKTRGILKSFSQ